MAVLDWSSSNWKEVSSCNWIPNFSLDTSIHTVHARKCKEHAKTTQQANEKRNLRRTCLSWRKKQVVRLISIDTQTVTYQCPKGDLQECTHLSMSNIVAWEHGICASWKGLEMSVAAETNCLSLTTRCTARKGWFCLHHKPQTKSLQFYPLPFPEELISSTLSNHKTMISPGSLTHFLSHNTSFPVCVMRMFECSVIPYLMSHSRAWSFMLNDFRRSGLYFWKQRWSKVGSQSESSLW